MQNHQTRTGATGAGSVRRKVWSRIAFWSLATVLLGIFSMARAESGWNMFRGNLQRTGYYGRPIGIPKSQPRWVDSLGCAFVSSPSVVDGTLYIGGRDSCLYAIDCRSGEIKWKKRTEGWVDSSPHVQKRTVLVGSRDGYLYELDGDDGSVVSQRTAGLQLSSPALLKRGTVLSGLGPPRNGVAAYDLSLRISQDALWSIGFPQMSYSSPAVRGDAAVIGASDGRLYAVDIGARSIVWSFPTQGGVYLSTPAIEDTVVYFAPGNYDRRVYALHLLTGELIWKSSGAVPVPLQKRRRGGQDLPPRAFVALLRMSPADRQSSVARLEQKGFAIPSALKNPRLAKRRNDALEEFFAYGGMKTSSVAVGTDNVYVIQKELGHPRPRFSLLALNKEKGTEAWRHTELRDAAQLGYCSSPLVSPHVVFSGWGEGAVHAFDAKSGEVLWQDTLRGHVISSPAVADSMLFFATMDGFVYRYDAVATRMGISFEQSTYCYPNPARKRYSHIQVYAEEEARLHISISTVIDQPVMHMRKKIPQGKYTHRVDVSDFANGVYLVRVHARYADGRDDRKTLKMAVLH